MSLFMRLPKEQLRILIALDKEHRKNPTQLVSIEHVVKVTHLQLELCAQELLLLNKAEYVRWYFHIGGPEGTSGQIQQPGRIAVQENSWQSKLESLPAEFVTALIPSFVGLILNPSAWQIIIGAF